LAAIIALEKSFGTSWVGQRLINGLIAEMGTSLHMDGKLTRS